MFFNNFARLIPSTLNGTTSSLLRAAGFQKNVSYVTEGIEPALIGFCNIQIRCNQRGKDYRPNAYQREKKHGLAKRKSTLNGKIILMRRMMRGRTPRTLTT